MEELEASIAGTGRAPVIGVGHSLGGYLTCMAAARRPDLFRAVILLDAPILGPFTGSAVQFAKRIGLIDRITPAGTTRNRRSTWPSVEAALAHFRRKPLFRQFDPDCLRDYVQHGTHASADGLTLLFDPEIEYRIYRTIPHDVADFASALRVPRGFIHGRHSEIVQRTGLAQTRRCLRVARVEGGHLFPFEVPHEAAHAIGAMVRQLTGL